jgi:hypothetical protein
MQLSLNRVCVLLFTAVIFTFLGLILPAYLYFGTKSLSIIRSIAYAVCCVCTLWVLLNSILSRRSKLSLFCYLFLFFILWVLVSLIIAKIYNIEGVDSDITSISYWLFALALGINLNEISKYKFFRFLTYLFWYLISFFVISSLDPVTLQAVYGIEDPLFAGAYQRIGDTFAFVSILLIVQQLKSIVLLSQKLNTTLDRTKKIAAKDIQQQLVIKNVQQQRNGRLSIGVICWMLMTWTASNIILFLNSSRASFYSFLILTLYLIYVFYVSYVSNKYVKQNILKLLILVLGMGLTIYMYLLLFHSELTSALTWDSLLTNRNLELLMNGNSSSLEGRDEFSAEGFQDIINNPVFGSYIRRVIDRGPGTYMHNFMEILQDFGIPAFASLLGLILYCIGYFLKSYRQHQQDYETIVFNGLLIYSIVQLLFFRDPLGFYAIHINFGIVVRRQLYPERLDNPARYRYGSDRSSGFL